MTATRTIPLAEPLLAGNEGIYVQECIDTNFVSSVGPFVTRFEEAFAGYVGSRHAVACVNGTAALHLALRLAGVVQDDRVAVSSFTFIASANAITYAGARPWLIDSEASSWNLDGDRLHADLEARARRGAALPAAIEVVHVLGHPAQMDALLAIRDRWDIPLVEDAAESLGATWTAGPHAGRHVGTVGLLGCFSFNGNKIITTGGGGMIVTDDDDLAARARHLSTQAKTTRRGYHHDEVGYNYRLTNVAAAMGLAQLEQLPDFLTRKARIAERYRTELADLPLRAAPDCGWARPSHWLSSVLLDDAARRDPVLDQLEAAGIQARPLWPPVHQQAPFATAARLGGEVAEDLHARGISLPSSVGLTEGDQGHVITAMHDALG